jgi:hypothetical protein
MQTGGAAGAAVAAALSVPNRDALALYRKQFEPVAAALRSFIRASCSRCSRWRCAGSRCDEGF